MKKLLYKLLSALGHLLMLLGWGICECAEVLKPSTKVLKKFVQVKVPSEE